MCINSISISNIFVLIMSVTYISYKVVYHQSCCNLSVSANLVINDLCGKISWGQFHCFEGCLKLVRIASIHHELSKIAETKLYSENKWRLVEWDFKVNINIKDASSAFLMFGVSSAFATNSNNLFMRCFY